MNTRALLIAGFALFSTGPALADYVVIRSDEPGLPAGTRLADAQPVEVATGRRVTLIAETGRKMELVGPHRGPVAGEGGGSGRRLDALAKLFRGEGVDYSVVGGVRGSGNRPQEADPWAVDVSGPAILCMAVDVHPAFRRGGPLTATALTIRNLATGERAVADWPDGESRLPWPEALTVRDADRYSLYVKGGDVHELTVLVIPPRHTRDVDRAVWMADHSCYAQARALLLSIE